MQDRPTALELVAAVQHFLETEILPAQEDQRLRFRTRIAANVLAILQRELSAGPAPIEQEYDRLRTLLPNGAETFDPADMPAAIRAMRLQLARQIRAGEADHDPWRAAVMTSTLAAVRAKLAISNPRFVTHDERR